MYDYEVFDSRIKCGGGFSIIPKYEIKESAMDKMLHFINKSNIKPVSFESSPVSGFQKIVLLYSKGDKK